MSAHDREMFEWVKRFNPYDLYSKSAERPSAVELRPYYQGLIDKYFPREVNF
jgi:inositol oxygenase